MRTARRLPVGLANPPADALPVTPDAPHVHPVLQILAHGPTPPARNMALDEALLVTAQERARTVLRFYGWTEPAATFGYFQRLAEVESATPLRPLIRRPTGGGIVPHDADWTYSLAVPPGHPWYDLRAVDSYASMHRWVVAAFRRLDIDTELAECCRKVVPGQCFQGWEKFDVLRLGRKIGGAAQRRNRLGLLIQGSIQPPRHADRAAWQEAMKATAAEAGFPSTMPLPEDARLEAIADELTSTRYGQASHNACR